MSTDWFDRDDDDECPVNCDPSFVVQVSIDEDECRVCHRRGAIGDDA